MSIIKKIKYVFPYTIPILTGYFFLGFAYGIIMSVNGFSLFWTIICSVFVYGGSLQYMLVSLLLLPFNPLSVFIVSIMIHIRHLFYDIAVIDKYKNLGMIKYYLAYALTDETFSIVCSQKIDESKISEKDFYLILSMLNQFYWVISSIMGAIAGGFINFSVRGLDFVMTALFIVINVEQYLNDKNHSPQVIGAVVSIICLLIFKSENFILPSMILITFILLLKRKDIEKKDIEIADNYKGK